MEKSWYLIIGATTMGPYTLEELAREPGLTPDTLVWRDGFADWVPARDVVELKAFFKDKKSPPPVAEDEEPKKKPLASSNGEILLAEGSEPPFFLIWLIVALLIFLYLAIQFIQNG